MIIWTNGCYDLLHPGHLQLLRYACSVGDRLIVGIDSDEKVKRDKGENRPFYNQEERKFMLLSTKYVETSNIQKAIKFANECATMVVQHRGVTTI